MKPTSPKEVWKIAVYRLRAFNAMTDGDVPKIYMPNYPPDKSDLLRLRNDMDSVVRDNDIVPEQCTFRYYITTRHLIETLGEMPIN